MTSPPNPTPDPLTPPLEALYWTQYGTWYPIFRRHAPKSTVIDLDDVQPQLLDWLNDLDRGWLAVLRAQAWDPEARQGVDVPRAHDGLQPPDGDTSGTVISSPLSQTERTRLRSLLIAGTARLEEWLVGLDAADADADYTAVLETMGLQQGFDDLFAGTLAEMGSFSGAVNVPDGMEGTC